MAAQIDDVRFPDKILRGAVGGPRYSTTIGTTDAGFEQRNQNWAESRRSFTVARKVTSEDQMNELVAFFHARAGRARGFLFRDPTDFYVGLSYVAGSGWTYGTPEVIGTGDDISTAFHLSKTYSSGAQSVVRQIHRPLDDQRADAPESAVAVKVYFDGVEQASGWTLNYATGTLTFTTPPANGVDVGWCGMFDIAARFDTDDAQLDVDAMWRAEWAGIPIVEIREADLPMV